MSRVSETVNRYFGLRGHALAVALACLAIYFGLTLVPNWWPSFAGTFAFTLYTLSIPVALIVLLVLLAWGGIGAALALRRGSAVTQSHRALVMLSIVGLLMFGAAVAAARSIKGALPTGSHLSEFDPAVWQDPNSSNYVRADITPRQKMLGSVVDRLNASQDRRQIEALLGPSLDTPYFESTGRDLIYILGPERDSFIEIDSEWLLIWLDNSGHFERFAIYRD